MVLGHPVCKTMRSSYTKKTDCLQWNIYLNVYFIFWHISFELYFTYARLYNICERSIFVFLFFFNFILNNVCAVSRISGAGCRFTPIIDSSSKRKRKKNIYFYTIQKSHVVSFFHYKRRTACRLHSTSYDIQMRMVIHGYPNDEQGGKYCRSIHTYVRIPTYYQKIFY